MPRKFQSVNDCIAWWGWAALAIGQLYAYMCRMEMWWGGQHAIGQLYACMCRMEEGWGVGSTSNSQLYACMCRMEVGWGWAAALRLTLWPPSHYQGRSSSWSPHPPGSNHHQTVTMTQQTVGVRAGRFCTFFEFMHFQVV